MAFVKFKDYQKPICLPAEKAAVMWLALAGYTEPTQEQRKFLRQVEVIYLNPRAPSTPRAYMNHIRRQRSRGQRSLFDKAAPQPVR